MLPVTQPFCIQSSQPHCFRKLAMSCGDRNTSFESCICVILSESKVQLLLCFFLLFFYFILFGQKGERGEIGNIFKILSLGPQIIFLKNKTINYLVKWILAIIPFNSLWKYINLKNISFHNFWNEEKLFQEIKVAKCSINKMW